MPCLEKVLAQPNINLASDVHAGNCYMDFVWYLWGVLFAIMVDKEAGQGQKVARMMVSSHSLCVTPPTPPLAGSHLFFLHSLALL